MLDLERRLLRGAPTSLAHRVSLGAGFDPRTGI